MRIIIDFIVCNRAESKNKTCKSIKKANNGISHMLVKIKFNTIGLILYSQTENYEKKTE